MSAPAGVRAARLVRWYPRSWRSRYGEEFTELLISDIQERPRSRSRTFDVARGGIVAHLGCLGLCAAGTMARSGNRPGAAMATTGCCLAVFGAVGVAIWSQLTIGWQWSAPQNRATAVAIVAMYAAVVAVAAIVVAAAVPVIGAVAARRSRRLAVPSAVFTAGLATMIIGARHFGNGWPGTGGHPWAHQGLVPGGVAAFSWASTMFVSSYWVHPAALAAFPPAQVAWMAASPVAVVCVAGGAAATVRRLALSPRVLRFEAFLAAAACFAMATFLAACCLWLGDGAAGPRNLFHAGAIDVAGVAVMAVALAVAQQSAAQARRFT